MRLDELERTGARIILTIVLFYDYCAAKKNTSLNIMRQFRLSLRARRIKRFNAFVSHSPPPLVSPQLNWADKLFRLCIIVFVCWFPVRPALKISPRVGSAQCSFLDLTMSNKNCSLLQKRNENIKDIYLELGIIMHDCWETNFNFDIILSLIIMEIFIYLIEKEFQEKTELFKFKSNRS